MPANDSQSPRVRTVTWQDPHISARDAKSISGLDYLRAIKEGKIKPPPVAVLIGYTISEVENGRVVFELEPAEYHYNPFASMHGGIISTVLDSAMTSAVLSALPLGVGCSTLEIKVNFVRPITSQTGRLRCEGKIVHIGSRIAIAEGKVMDSRDKLHAYAVNTCLILPAEREM